MLLGLLAPAWGQSSDNKSVIGLQVSLQDSISRLNRSLVGIVAIGSGGPMIVGTGFIIADDGTFVTAAHVLRQPPGLQIRALIRLGAAGQKAAEFEKLGDDAERDIAICRIVAEHGMRPPMVPLPLADSSRSAAGTLVVSSGFPLASERPSSHLGIVSTDSAGDQYVEIAVMVNEGESGAPVMRLDDGKVIGMVSSVRIASTYAGAGHGAEDQNAGLALAAPAEWVTSLLHKAIPQAPGPR
ncbi:MAG TPA: serine protease [Terriglobales bacterium]|nr:serine protease [Terriglobales bacterium]